MLMHGYAAGGPRPYIAFPAYLESDCNRKLGARTAVLQISPTAQSRSVSSQVFDSSLAACSFRGWSVR